MISSTETCRAALDALDQTPEAVIMTDAAGTVVYANPACGPLTGLSADKIVGRTAAALKNAGYAEGLCSGILEAAAAGKEWRGRFTARNGGGAERVFYAGVFPTRRERSGPVTGYTAFCRDITAEAAAEERLSRERSLEALGRLAGRLAHDFNNLLTIIIGSMELIMETLPAGMYAKLGGGILQASKESAGLIRKLLIFAGRQECSPETASLDKFLEAAMPGLSLAAGPGHKVELSLGTGLPGVKLHPEQFGQAITALVANAGEAMPSGGTIKITAYGRRAEKNDADGINPGEYAVVEVSDTGRGLPPEAAALLFEPFFSTKPKGKTSGLGLAAAYGIIRQHKGRIMAETRPGMGTVFRIYLPKAL